MRRFVLTAVILASCLPATVSAAGIALPIIPGLPIVSGIPNTGALPSLGNLPVLTAIPGVKLLASLGTGVPVLGDFLVIPGNDGAAGITGLPGLPPLALPGLPQ